MSLFNLPSIRDRDKDFIAAKKASDNTAVTSSVKIKGTKTLIDRISSIKEVVDRYLGDKKDKYEIITDELRLSAYITKAIMNGEMAIDTETEGLNIFINRIAGICLYTPNEKAVYIPLNHESYITNVKVEGQLPIEVVAKQMNRLINTKLIYHSATFDIRVMRRIGIDLGAYWDTFIGARLLNENETDNSLKGLYKKYILRGAEDTFRFNQLFDGIPFTMIPIKIGYMYAANDPLITYELFKFQEKFLTVGTPECESQSLEGPAYVMREIEMPMIMVACDMEDYGVAFDYEVADKLHDKYKSIEEEAVSDYINECAKYKDKIEEYIDKHSAYGETCLLQYPPLVSSPEQLRIFIYDVIGQKQVDRKKPRGTGAKILDKMDNPIAKKILSVRKVQKLLTTYIDNLPKKAKEYDDRIHYRLNTIGADCVVGSSLILTDKGYIPIKDFVTSSADKEFIPCDINIVNRYTEYEKATSTIKFTDVDTIKIKTRFGFELEGTPNHPILVSNVTQSMLNSNKSSCNRNRLHNSVDFKQLDNINIGDIVEIPYGFNKFPHNYVNIPELYVFDNHFNCKKVNKQPILMDENLAELLGIYNADGSIKTSNGSYTIRISNKNEDVISRTLFLFEKIFGIKGNVCKSNTTMETYVSAKNIAWFDKLVKHGARNKAVCSYIMESPWSVISSFIKGCTLDSSLDINRQKLTLTIMDNTTANFIRDSLINKGIICRISKGSLPDGRKYNRLSVVGTEYVKFINYIGVIESRKLITINNPTKPKVITINNKIYLSVISKESSISDVYDFHVPQTHSFIANSIVCHNTGRTSTADPSTQNIPSHAEDIRTMFKASDGKIMIGADYSGQEVRLVSCLANDQKMIQAYRDGKDIYCVVASIAFGLPYEDCTEHFTGTDMVNPEGKARRNKAKQIVLGILYRKGIKAIAEDLNVDEIKAQEIQDAVLKNFPDLAICAEQALIDARTIGYVSTFWGRKRRLPDINLPVYEFSVLDNYVGELDDGVLPQYVVDDYMKRINCCRSFSAINNILNSARYSGILIMNNSKKIAEAERQALNARVQGSAADLTKKAMLLVNNNLRLQELGCKLLLTIHDELVIEAPVENGEDAGHILINCMLNAGKELAVPLSCDAVYSYCWYGDEYEYVDHKLVMKQKA